MKNENEIKTEEGILLQKIKKCVCLEKVGEFYDLRCKIHQRGERYYSYRPGSAYISKDLRHRFYLSDGKDGALHTVIAAVSAFEEATALLKTDENYVDLRDGMTTLYYRHNADNTVDFLLCRCCNDCKEETLYPCYTVSKMLREISFGGASPATGAVFRHASNGGDELLALQTRLYENAADEKECARLGELLNERVLPKLPEEYNRDIVVCVDESLKHVLDSSGYRILHRPYFGMKDSTHQNWTLNPCTKTGVDAANIREEAISSSEFLALF